uniref:Uncharacterized protein n=1 Tax=viral metagenome TaxID=1070528 RepID=A0A6M3ISM3_9ZZZZ
MTLEWLWWQIEASYPRIKRLNFETLQYLAKLIHSNKQSMKYINQLNQLNQHLLKDLN